MSEPNTKGPDQTPSNADLGTELRELGQQIEQAVRRTLESEQAKNLQRDISAGMREIGTQLQAALHQLREDQRVQNLAERGQQALNQARESQAVKDFQDALTRGISQLNAQLTAYIERQQTGGTGSTETPSATSTQRVPIEHEPTTGETTRLDPKKDEW
ncbi:MAG: hypothetical protein MUD01_06245 [Chloroflexaceae bacterium]|jgi:hypothetical protein|nr:hypothetical protein [Chloroflexaceae bacterium]